jgi:[ribosomal protein S5]-alanine N-acetyltransferase
MLELKFDKFPVLETPRLILRQVQMGDLQAMHKMRTDSAIMAYMDTEIPKTINDTQKKIEQELDSFSKGNSVYWAITLKDTNEMVGGAGYWRITKEHFRAEIGYQLMQQYWRKGYSLEALKSIIQFGFEKMGLHSIEGNVNPKNDPSIKLLEKLGFKQEAYFKENFYYNGKFLDSLIYSLLVSNWNT